MCNIQNIWPVKKVFIIGMKISPGATTICSNASCHSPVQLSESDSYEGGDLIFDLPPELCPDKELMRKQGTIIIFPSFVRHMVTPVTEGERHAMVSWIEGLNFR